MAAPKQASWVPVLISALERCGSVTRAAAVAGVSASAVHKRRARHADFDADCKAAVARWRGAGEEAALARAAALPVAPVPETLIVRGPDGARVEPITQRRMGKLAREAFLAELAASGSVRRAAEACGFSPQTLYRKRMREADFARAWDACVETGRARLEAALLERARRSVDPDALPIGDADAKVSVAEAVNILKYGAAKTSQRPSTSLGTNGAQSFEEAEQAAAEVEAARGRILARIERMEARTLRERAAAGWREVEHEGERVMIPPGYVKAPSAG